MYIINLIIMEVKNQGNTNKTEVELPAVSSNGEVVIVRDNHLFSLPSVEQMQRDVANATCELQRTYIPRKKLTSETHESGNSLSEATLNMPRTVFPEETAQMPSEEEIDLDDPLKEDDSEELDPKKRTREETVMEELLIDGKRYRHTYQRRVVLERQKTREVFILPSSPKRTRTLESTKSENNCTSANFDSYNNAFESEQADQSSESTTTDRGSCGMRLDLSVHNEEGGFNPVVIVVPQQQQTSGDQSTRSGCIQQKKDGLKATCPGSDSPSRRTHIIKEDKGVSKMPGSPGRRTDQLENDQLPVATSNGKCNTPTTPLLFSHMYHFGKWDKESAILDPRLPAGITQQPGSGIADLVFCVSPAEWHQTDISYGGDTQHSLVSSADQSTANAMGAKGRIVACLQRFTQRSAQTGRQLHRSTYVQHTKIARWRSMNKQDNIETSLESEPSPSSSVKPQSLKLHGLDVDDVPSIERAWKPGGAKEIGSGLATCQQLSPGCSMEACCYDRLQILQSICPAAAAATIILGRQIPDMRPLASRKPTMIPGDSSMPAPPLFTVSADAWCPRALMLLDADTDALIFGEARVAKATDGDVTAEKENEHQNWFLRGGTLDDLLVYTLKIIREQRKGSYDSLIPDILLKIYPTFTTTAEVVGRLIQRYIAYTPIEPGGMVFVSKGCDQHYRIDDGSWSEALNTLRFLVELVTDAPATSFSSQLNLKLVQLAKLLEIDSQTASRQLNLINLIDKSPVKTAVNAHQENASRELADIANSLLLLMPTISGGLKPIEKRSSSLLTKHYGIKTTNKPTGNQTIDEDVVDNIYCQCQEKLNKLLSFDPKCVAEQITLMEECHFDSIDLIELINIKQLMKGNTPSLSRCVKHFNDISNWVKILSFLANEFGPPKKAISKPGYQIQTGEISDDITSTTSEGGLVCSACDRNIQPASLLSREHGTLTSLTALTNSLKCPASPSKIKGYLCMPTRTPHLSMRSKRHNILLEEVLWKLCSIAEELKAMNNFSSFLAIILGLQNASIQKISKKLKNKITSFSTYMLPPVFSEYRRDLEAAKMPCIPYLGLIFQQLIHLETGNLLFLPSTSRSSSTTDEQQHLISDDEQDSEKIVNFWRCWKHYLILGYFFKRNVDGERKSYNFIKNNEMQAYLQSFEGFFDRHIPTDSNVKRRQSFRLRRAQRSKTFK